MQLHSLAPSILGLAAMLIEPHLVSGQQPPPGYQMPAFVPQPPPPSPTCRGRPLTADEITAIDMKLATMREAFGVILEFRRNNPQPALLQLPDVQRLYRMILPIVRAAERVEARSNGMGVLEQLNPRGPIGTMDVLPQGGPDVASPPPPPPQPNYYPHAGQQPPYEQPVDFPPADPYGGGYVH